MRKYTDAPDPRYSSHRAMELMRTISAYGSKSRGGLKVESPTARLNI